MLSVWAPRPVTEQLGRMGGGRVGSTVSSGATKIATAAVQVQPSLLNMV